MIRATYRSVRRANVSCGLHILGRPSARKPELRQKRTRLASMCELLVDMADESSFARIPLETWLEILENLSLYDWKNIRRVDKQCSE
jgi:hypothetical protein